MAFDALPSHEWPPIAAVIPLPWPKFAAKHDLRWYAANHANLGKPLPSVRELADRWGWRRSAAHSLILRADEWRDPARPWGWREPGQQPDSNRTATGQTERVNAGQLPNNGQQPDSNRTATGLTRDPLPGSPEHQSTRAPKIDPYPVQIPAATATAPPKPSPPLAVVHHLPDPPPRPQDAHDLSDVLGTRPDLMRLLLAPQDPADARVSSVATLAEMTVEDLSYRRGIGPKRASQIAELMQDAGFFLPDSRPKTRREEPTLTYEQLKTITWDD